MRNCNAKTYSAKVFKSVDSNETLVGSYWVGRFNSLRGAKNSAQQQLSREHTDVLIRLYTNSDGKCVSKRKIENGTLKPWKDIK